MVSLQTVSAPAEHAFFRYRILRNAVHISFWCQDTDAFIQLTISSTQPFDVGNHSWVVSTKDEEIIISGGGPDDGAPNQMAFYRSELGGYVQEWQ
jgi:hypothetical protein